MSDEQDQFQNWEQVIVHFFETKIAQSKLYKAKEFIETKTNQIESETDSKKKEKLFIAKKEKQSELVQLKRDAPSTEVRDWVESTSKKRIAKGKRIIKATHVLRFTHSSAESDGLLLIQKETNSLLSTSSLKKNLTYDMAHNNGNLITISRFLALKLSGQLIIDLIHANNFCFLEPFADNPQQFESWCSGFSNLVEKREINTVDRAKQAYFPLAKAKNTPLTETKYHLLCPLFSSSLAEEIYAKINTTKYGDEQKNAREQAKKENDKPAKYYAKPLIRFPNLGIQKFGGAQPQNVSMLNKGRTWKASQKDNNTWGITYLFSAQPPTWQSQLKAPIDKESLFAYFSTSSINDDIHYLREYLLRFERLGLSIKDPNRQDWIVTKVQEDTENGFNSIIDEVLFYAGSIQNLRPNWTDIQGIKLKDEHQYFLDPHRDDANFQNKRKTTDWQSVVCQDFAQWLNRKLEGKEKQFTPQREHTRLWQRLFASPLREHCEMLAITHSDNTEEPQA